MEAVTEYPNAKSVLVERGREIDHQQEQRVPVGAGQEPAGRLVRLGGDAAHRAALRSAGRRRRRGSSHISGRERVSRLPQVRWPA